MVTFWSLFGHCLVTFWSLFENWKSYFLAISLVTLIIFGALTTSQANEDTKARPIRAHAHSSEPPGRDWLRSRCGDLGSPTRDRARAFSGRSRDPRHRRSLSPLQRRSRPRVAAAARRIKRAPMQHETCARWHATVDMHGTCNTTLNRQTWH